MDPLAQQFGRYRDSGDLRALGAVFDELAPRLFLIALHLTGRRADAEDVLQETFLLAIERAATFDASRRLEPWLAGMLTNLARNARRRARRAMTDELPDRADLAADPAAGAERRELLARVRAQLDVLPVDQRQVLLLQLQHGLSPTEIAEVLDVPAGTVRMRVHRGLRALRQSLPAKLFGFVAFDVPLQSLATVRASVLRAAAPHAAAVAAAVALTTTSTATLIGGSILMKKLFVIAAAALACGVLWWTSVDRLDPPSLDDRPTSPITQSAVSTATDATSLVAESPTIVRQPVPTVASLGGLRVRVVAAVGDERLALPGMLVELWEGEGTLPPYSDALLRRRTDTRGEVLLPALTCGTWQARLPSVDETPAAAAVVAPGIEATLELVQPANHVVRGIVVDADGAPIAGAELWLHRGSWLGRYGLPEPVDVVSRCAGVSGPDGRFVVPAVLRESRIAASHPGHGESMGRYLANGVDDVRLVLGRAFATLAVTVRDPNGAPVAGALVRLDPPGTESRRAADGALMAPRVPRLAHTDAAGNCSFVGLAPGSQRVTASAGPRNSAGQTIEVAAFERAGVTLDLLDGVTVVGTARTADGSPARLRISSRRTIDENGHFSHCDVREDGSYLLPYQPRRSFVVVAIDQGAVVASREIVDPTPGIVRCDFVIDALQTLRGRVVTDDGRGLEGWHVTSVSATGHTRETLAAADGSFVFPLAKDTTCTLTAAAPWATSRPLVTLADVRGAGPVELRVPAAKLPTSSVRGRLVAADGTPVEARSLVLVATSEMTIEQRPTRLLIHDRRAELRTRTAVDGTFVFTDLGEDRYALGCYFGGNQLPLRVDLELATAQQLELGELLLPTMATLLVEFVHDDGRPWISDVAGIELRNVDGDEVIVDHAHDDRGLRLTVEPGVYQLSLRATDLIAPPLTVTLTGGATTRQRVPLTIGRTCLLKFNSDGAARPEPRARLQVVVRDSAGAVVHQSDARQASDLRGFRYWTLRTTLPFGRYEAEATGDDGLRYRGSFELGADVERSTDFDLPQQR